MSQKQPEQGQVPVKYKLDEFSKVTAKKLEISSFRTTVAKDARLLLSNNLRASSGSR